MVSTVRNAAASVQAELKRLTPDSLERVLSGRASLREGASGAGVVELQKLLNERGAKLTRDGDFGPRTEAALRGFQRSNGLEPSGVLDAKTLKKLVQPRTDAESDRLVKVGDKGKDVLAAEKRLHKLGYDTGAVDGRFDQKTAKAVRAFKADQPDLESTVGHLGKAGKDALQREASAVEHAPFKGRVKKSEEHRRLDELTGRQVNAQRAVVDEATGSVSQSSGLRLGDAGRGVRNIQAHLKNAGFSTGAIDGKFDERTQGAVRNFQKKSGIDQSGIVDGDTWRALKRARIYADGPTAPAQRVGERSDAVKKTEKLLEKAGYDVGKVDGVFDGKMLKALHKFEREHDMARTNGVGRKQLQAIEKAAKNGGLVQPIAAPLRPGSEFGVRDAEGAPANNGARFHAGKDWFAPAGAAVRAPVDGKIVEVRASTGNSGQVFGGTVKVQAKDGKVYVFRHVDPKNVRVGQNVDAGDRIASVTRWAGGAHHAHVEVWKTFAGGYDFENMIDPMKIFGRFLK